MQTLSIPVQNFRRVVYRWFSGRPLDGRRRTNCTPLRVGTKAVGDVPVSRWSYLPGWKRSLIRQCLLFGPAFAGLLAWRHPRVFLALAWLLFGALVYCRGLPAYERWADRRHTRTYVEPLHAVLPAVLGLPDTARPVDYLAVPRTFTTDETTPVRVTLPRTFIGTPDQRAQLVDVILGRLGVSREDLDPKFSFVKDPYLTLTMAPKPPEKVPLASVMPLIRDLAKGEVLLGLDKRKEPYSAGFNGDDPHWGFSCGSRRGKSTMMQVTAAQLAAQDPGFTATFVDVKRTSFAPFHGVPGFTILNDPRRMDLMWEGIAAFCAEMNRRMDIVDNDPTAEFPLNVMFLDECNQFAAMSKKHWRKIREKGDPPVPPVWDDISAIVWQGAQFRCHMIVAGQRLDNEAFGGIGLRDSLGFRGLAGYRHQQWKMLIGTSTVPRAQKQRGRWIYSDGNEETWVQNIWATPQEVRDLAMTGRRDVAGPVSQVPAQGAAGPGTTGVPGTTLIVGLAAGADYVGCDLEAFRKRRIRAELEDTTRIGNQPAWTPEQLDQLKKVPA